MIKHHRYLDFFPYPIFRKDQEQIIDQIEKSARQGKNILLVAPNGTGKTVIALSGLLPLAHDKGFKIVYLCRTHAQSSRVIKELSNIDSSLSGTNNSVAGISIRGRNDMCLNNVLLKLRASPTESMGVCADLRKNNHCVYYRNVSKLKEKFKSLDLFQFKRPVDAEELMDYCNPEDDSYQVALDEAPMFFPDSNWLDYLTIYDKGGNYYSAGVTGNDHQLHFEPATNTFTWNPSFNQYPEYFGMDFEEPLIIEANSTLFFEYATNKSWTEAIRIDEQNIDLDSIRVVYDYNYLLKPEHYDWLYQFGTAHSYENIAYSFKEESEYRAVQYYYETFSVYAAVDEYTHIFNLNNLTFGNDFVNLSLYQVIGLTPTFDTEILTDNANFSLNFDETTNNLTITDLNSDDGLLDVFDQITAIVNYSYAPISTYTEIFLLDNFNQTYLSDQTETFYSSVDIDYNFRSESGVPLFAEGSNTITSESTSFKNYYLSRLRNSP